MRQQIQKFGRALSGMVMPNIGAFIAWGFVTALFIPSGWWPNTQMARLVDPMLTYLLPLLIAYTAGRNVAGERGGVIGAIAAMGVIVGSDIPMFIGVMVMGPLGGYTIRWFDKYLDSPEPELDQSGTYKAIDEMQMFLEYFPRSEKAKEAQDIIFALQEKLVEKEWLNAQLYYNLGNYMGNNYDAAVITAQNALKDYPYTKRKEDLSMLILKSKYQEAIQSVEEKKIERFRDVIDEYYSFINDFPDGANAKDAKKIFNVASKYVKD